MKNKITAPCPKCGEGGTVTDWKPGRGLDPLMKQFTCNNPKCEKKGRHYRVKVEPKKKPEKPPKCWSCGELKPEDTPVLGGWWGCDCGATNQVKPTRPKGAAPKVGGTARDSSFGKKNLVK